MNRTFHTLLLLICFYSATHAQPNITLSKTVGGPGLELIRDMIADADGNLIAVALIDSFNQDAECDYKGGAGDVILIKMDPHGNILWQKCFGGSDFDDPYQIIQTNDEGFLLVAVTESNDGDVTFNHGGPDIWLVKTDSVGDMQWEKSIGSSSGDNPYDLNQLSDGSYVLAAYTIGINGDFPAHYGGLNDDAWLVFITVAGQVDTTVHFGGTDDDYITEVLELENGDLQLFGSTSSVDFDLDTTIAFGSRDAWMIRADSMGAIKWMKRWGGNFSDGIFAAIKLPGSRYITAGSTSSNSGEFAVNHGQNDTWIMQIDSVGNVLINKLYGGSGNDVVTFRNRIITTENGLFTIGASTLSWDGDVGLNIGYNDFWLLTVDSNCNLISSKVSGGSNEDFIKSNSVAPGNIALQAGQTFSNDFDIVDFTGETDGWFIKIDGITLLGNIEPQKNLVTIYPNPLRESFSLLAENKNALKNALLEIYSLQGTLLLKRKINDSEETILIHGISPGMYHCLITDRQNHRLTSAKLVVQ